MIIIPIFLPLYLLLLCFYRLQVEETSNPAKKIGKCLYLSHFILLYSIGFSVCKSQTCTSSPTRRHHCLTAAWQRENRLFIFVLRWGCLAKGRDWNALLLQLSPLLSSHFPRTLFGPLFQIDRFVYIVYSFAHVQYFERRISVAVCFFFFLLCRGYRVLSSSSASQCNTFAMHIWGLCNVRHRRTVTKKHCLNLIRFSLHVLP